jgi:hypothetical protein
MIEERALAGWTGIVREFLDTQGRHKGIVKIEEISVNYGVGPKSMES